MTDLHKLFIVVDVDEDVPQVMLEDFRAAGDRIEVFGSQTDADGAAVGKIFSQGSKRGLAGFQGCIALIVVEKKLQVVIGDHMRKCVMMTLRNDKFALFASVQETVQYIHDVPRSLKARAREHHLPLMTKAPSLAVTPERTST